MPSKSPPSFALMIGDRLDKKDGMMPHDGENQTEPAADDQADKMEESAMGAMIDAVHAKDVVAAKEALKDFIEICLEKLQGGGYDDGDEGGADQGMDDGNSY